MTTRVLLVDDHRVFTQGLAMMLSMQPDIEVVDRAMNGEDALVKVQQHQPHVVVMDIRMEPMNGVEATRRVRGLCPASQVVLLTQYDTMEYVWDGMHAGALSYMLKEDEPEDVLDAIRAAARGEARMSQKPLRLLQEGVRNTNVRHEDGSTVPRLTPRESEVLYALIQDGTTPTNRQLADRLMVSEHTIKTHMDSIFKKLGVTQRHDVAAVARRYDLV